MRASLRLLALFGFTAVVAPVIKPLAAQGFVPDTSAQPADSLRQVADTAPAPQDSSIDRSALAPASHAGISITGMRAGVHARETARPNASVMTSNAGLGQSRAMMIVGGAALVVGAIIGDTPGTILMVGGAIVGLVGLYNYLQ